MKQWILWKHFIERLNLFLNNQNISYFNNVCEGATGRSSHSDFVLIFRDAGMKCVSFVECVCCFKAGILTLTQELKSVRLWCNKGGFKTVETEAHPLRLFSLFEMLFSCNSPDEDLL